MIVRFLKEIEIGPYLIILKSDKQQNILGILAKFSEYIFISCDFQLIYPYFKKDNKVLSINKSKISIETD